MMIARTGQIDVRHGFDHRSVPTSFDTLDKSGRLQSPAPRGFFFGGLIVTPGAPPEQSCSGDSRPPVDPVPPSPSWHAR
jgi:hypothetical protein